MSVTGTPLGGWILGLAPDLSTPVAIGFEAVTVCLFGLLHGSFASLLSWRLPRDLPVVFDRSRCVACSRPLSAIDLIPLFAWLFRAGRCGCGESRVSIRYPLIEVTMLALFVAVWLMLGISLAGVALAGLGFCLIAASLADLETLILPDELLSAALGFGVLWVGATSGWTDLQGWLTAASGAAFGFGLSWAVQAGYKALRQRDGLGFGDVKLFGVAGWWIGPMAFPWLLLIAGLVGLVLGGVWRLTTGEARIPFGPAIAAALLAILAIKIKHPIIPGL